MNARELRHALRDVPDNARIVGFDLDDDGEFTVRLVTYHAGHNSVLLISDPDEFLPGEKILHRDQTEQQQEAA